MNAPAELDIRIAAFQAEYNEQLAVLSNKCAGAMGEVAWLKAQLAAIEAAAEKKRKKVEALAEKKRAKAELAAKKPKVAEPSATIPCLYGDTQ